MARLPLGVLALADEVRQDWVARAGDRDKFVELVGWFTAHPSSRLPWSARLAML